MATCAFCGSEDPPVNTEREHFFIPPIGCIIKKKPTGLPACT